MNLDLQNVLERIDNRLAGLETDMKGLKADVSTLKTDMETVKHKLDLIDVFYIGGIHHLEKGVGPFNPSRSQGRHD